LTTITVNLLTY